ncbi:MAG TPA: TolC family protein [Candidatus Kryptonia bacterium]
MDVRRAISSIIGLTLLSVAAQSQVKPYSLADYLKVALTRNLLIGSADQATASAEYGNSAIRNGFFPQISVGSHLIVAPGYDEAITNGGEFGAQLGGTYTIYDGGARSLEIEKGGIGVERTRVNRTRVAADVVFAVSVAFVEAAKEKRELGVVAQGYALISDYLQLTKQLHASGQGSETDVLKTTVELNNASIDIATRKVAYRNALLTLSQASGLSIEDVVDVDTTLVYADYDTTLDLERNIDLQSGELEVKQARLDAQIAGSKLKPSVSVAADAGALTSLPNVRPGLAGVFGASIGLSFSIPVFTFGSIEDSYRAANASANSLALQNDYARSSLRSVFQMTRNDIESADSEMSSLQKNLGVAEQSLLLSRARYAGGSGLSIEVLDAIRSNDQIRLAIEDARAERDTDIFKLNRLNYAGVSR